MNYSVATLLVSGILGILSHNLIKINELNRKNAFTASMYFRMEWPSIMLNLVLVSACVLWKHDFVTWAFDKAALPTGVAIFTIGYSGQSILLKVMGRANKALGDGK